MPRPAGPPRRACPEPRTPTLLTSRYLSTEGGAMKWDPEQYLRRRDERARPFYDLVARIEASAPRTVVDLGCGPGNLTRFLAQRWPDALVLGVDSSPEMVAAAAEHAIEGRLGFELGDVQTWAPAEPVDVVV